MTYEGYAGLVRRASDLESELAFYRADLESCEDDQDRRGIMTRIVVTTRDLEAVRYQIRDREEILDERD